MDNVRNAAQNTELRELMQLDVIDLELEKRLGYTVQFVRSEDRCTYLVIPKQGAPRPCDSHAAEIYHQLRDTFEVLNKIRGTIDGHRAGVV